MREQEKYARLAGLMYLLNYATAVFGTMMGTSIKGSGTFHEKAQRVLTSEHMYRAALASLSISWLLIVVLAFSLYVTLEPVNRRLAQLALCMELCQAVVGAMLVVLAYAPLHLFEIAPGGFTDGQLQTLIRAFGSASDTGFQISMTFLGIGSTIFFYLFYRSTYIPKALALWSFYSSILFLIVSIAIPVFPEYTGKLLYAWAPMGIAEVGTALWLLFKGIRIPELPRLVSPMGEAA